MIPIKACFEFRAYAPLKDDQRHVVSKEEGLRLISEKIAKRGWREYDVDASYRLDVSTIKPLPDAEQDLDDRVKFAVRSAPFDLIDISYVNYSEYRIYKFLIMIVDDEVLSIEHSDSRIRIIRM